MVLALVDYKKRFLDVEIGWPGSVPDNRLFQISSLSKRYEAALEPLGTTPLRTGNDTVENIPAYILGDSAYLNCRHLATTYTNDECNADASVSHLNNRLGKARYIVENAFGLLKGRFQIFEKPLRSGSEDLPFAVHLIASCFVLHNFLIEEQDVESEEMFRPQIERQIEIIREEDVDSENERTRTRTIDNGTDALTRSVLLRHMKWLDSK